MADKFTNLYKMITDGYDMDQSFLRGVIYTLEWLDDYPEALPKPTVTESRLVEIIAFAKRNSLGTKGIVSAAGVAIVPDPKPTNAERWQELLAQYKDEATGLESFGDWADRKGLRAPEADDD